MTPKIMVIGSINMDLVYRVPYHPLPGETITSTMSMLSPGGKGANQAVACARVAQPNPASSFSSSSSLLQGTVSMVGAVGAPESDAYSTEALHHLVEGKVDVSLIRRLPQTNTGTAVVMVEEETGENRIILAPGANAKMTPDVFADDDYFDKLPAGQKPDMVVLQLEIPRETVLRVLSLAKKAGVPVCLNPAPAQALPDEALNGLEHLIVNRTETAIVLGLDAERDVATPDQYRQCCAALRAKGVQNVVITLGGDGAAFQSNAATDDGDDDDDGFGYVPAEKGVKVVDTTGAGDTFIGAYVQAILAAKQKRLSSSSLSSSSQLLTSADIAKAVRFASHAGAKAVQVQGAQSSVPWNTDLDLSLLS